MSLATDDQFCGACEAVVGARTIFPMSISNRENLEKGRHEKMIQMARTVHADVKMPMPALAMLRSPAVGCGLFCSRDAPTASKATPPVT
jgi:hypothetical protein